MEPSVFEVLTECSNFLLILNRKLYSTPTVTQEEDTVASNYLASKIAFLTNPDLLSEKFVVEKKLLMEAVYHLKQIQNDLSYSIYKSTIYSISNFNISAFKFINSLIRYN